MQPTENSCPTASRSRALDVASRMATPLTTECIPSAPTSMGHACLVMKSSGPQIEPQVRVEGPLDRLAEENRQPGKVDGSVA